MQLAWQSGPLQRSARASKALLRACTALFAAATSLQDASVRTAKLALRALGKWLIQSYLKPLYHSLSSEDPARANQALALLAALVALSDEHLRLWLQHFDLHNAACARLAAPTAPRKRVRDDDSGAAADAPAHKHWTASKPGKRPSRACFIDLALACLQSAESGASVTAVLRAPMLLPLVLHSLARDPAHVQLRVCNALLDRALVDGVQHLCINILLASAAAELACFVTASLIGCHYCGARCRD